MTQLVWEKPELEQLISDPPSEETKLWALNRLVEDYPSEIAIGEWLESDDPNKKLYALRLIGQERNKDFLDQASALYEEAVDESESIAAGSAVMLIDPNRFFDAFNERIEENMKLHFQEIVLLAKCAQSSGKGEHYAKLLEFKDKLFQAKDVGLADFALLFSEMLKHAHFGQYEELLRMYWKHVMRPDAPPQLQETFGANLVAFYARRMLAQFPPTSQVFENLSVELLAKINERFPRADVIWTVDVNTNLSEMVKQRRIKDLMTALKELAEEMAARKGVGDSTIPADDPEAEVPLAARVREFLTVIERMIQNTSLKKLAPTYQGFLILQGIYLLTVAELGVAEVPPEEELKELSIAERIEKAYNPLLPPEKVREYWELPEGYTLTEDDKESLATLIKQHNSDSLDVLQNAIRALPTREMFDFIWSLLPFLKSEASLSAVATAYAAYPEEIFDWAEEHLKRLHKEGALILAFIASKGQKAAVDFVVKHHGPLYKINRAAILGLAETTRAAAMRDVLERYHSPVEAELGQGILKIAAAHGMNDDRIDEVQNQVDIVERDQMRLAEEHTGEHDPQMIFEFLCQSCGYAYNYEVDALWIERAFLENKREQGDNSDPYFIREDMRCKHCGSTNRLVLSNRSRQRVQGLISLMRQADIRGTNLGKKIQTYNPVKIGEQSYNPRNAAVALDNVLRQDPTNQKAIFTQVELYDFLGKREKSLDTLDNAAKYFPRDFRFPGSKAHTLWQLDRTEEAFEHQKQAVALFHEHVPIPPSKNPQAWKQSQQSASEVYAHLRNMSKELGKQGEADELIREKPIARFFPKADRNDSCPCGSGKKFKACCLKHAR